MHWHGGRKALLRVYFVSVVRLVACQPGAREALQDYRASHEGGQAAVSLVHSARQTLVRRKCLRPYGEWTRILARDVAPACDAPSGRCCSNTELRLNECAGHPCKMRLLEYIQTPHFHPFSFHPVTLPLPSTAVGTSPTTHLSLEPGPAGGGAGVGVGFLLLDRESVVDQHQTITKSLRLTTLHRTTTLISIHLTRLHRHKPFLRIPQVDRGEVHVRIGDLDLQSGRWSVVRHSSREDNTNPVAQRCEVSTTRAVAVHLYLTTSDVHVMAKAWRITRYFRT